MNKVNEETKSSFLSLYLKDSLQMGKVHTLFKNSLNIEFPVGLIHVGQIGMPLSPFGCLIKPEAYKQLYAHCQPGDLVRFKNGKLVFYTQSSVLEIELDTFLEINLSIPTLTITSSELKSNLFYQTIEKAKYHFLLETGLPMTDRIRDGLLSLTEVQEDKKKVQDEEMIRLLIGRGIGLTPSGDDILIGYTFARTLFNKAKRWKKKVDAALKEKKTTAISEAYFKCLLEGYINENFLHLTQLFTINDEKKITNEIDALKQFGHTSGIDTLYGFALGLQYVQKEWGKES